MVQPRMFSLPLRTAALLAAAMVVTGLSARTRAADVNLASVAKPSASFTSGDTRVDALNDGREPRNSRGGRGGSYGNWPRRDTQWVEYEWPQAISTNRIEVYWWD